MATTKTLELRVCSTPHNGTAQYRRIDPIDGASVGGQYLYIRTAMRRKRFVGVLGRRWGKSTLRPFLWAVEGQMTKGHYAAAFVTSVHQKAWEMFTFCKEQLGGLVRDFKGEPESQNRYLDLEKLRSNENPEVAMAWAWNDPDLGPKIRAGWNRNEGGRIYFLSGQYPMVQAIQGFPWPMARISLDEVHQQHPMVTRIVNPMLIDSGGALDISGIPDLDAIGNNWFEEYFQRTKDPKRAHRWAGLNFPTYDNPHLNKEALSEIQDDLVTDDDYRQYVLGEFIGGSGSVFSNLAKVFTVQPRWRREHDSHKDLPPWVLELLARAPSDLLRCWIAEADANPAHSIAMSVDFAGRTRTRDATVITVFDMTECRQIAVFTIRGMQSPDQLHWIEGVKNHYQCGEIYGDETPEGAALMGYLRERYRTGVIGVKFSASNKAEYIKRGQFLFEMAEVALIDCVEQREEFRIFKRIVSESLTGVDPPVRYSHPPGKNDDFVAAFLGICPSLVYGKRAAEQAEPAKEPLIGDDGMLNLSALNEDIKEDLEEGEETVVVRTRR